MGSNRRVRHLRVLTNASIAAALLASYLVAAALHLNPSYPLAESGPLFVVFAAAYGGYAVVTFYMLVVLRQVAALQVLSPGWVSVRVLAWMSTIAAAAGSAVLWLNAADFAPFLDPGAARRMTLAALAVAICGGVTLALALAHIGRRGTAPSGVLLVTTMVLSAGVPLMLRQGPPAPAPNVEAAPPADPSPARSDVPGGRVVLLAVDGASLDYISVTVAQGGLPNFGRLLDGGTATHLATLRPTQAEPIWTTVATGRLPQTSGVRSARRYRAFAGGSALDVLPDYMFSQALVRYGYLTGDRHTAASMAAQPLWRILSDRGVRVGVIGWPLTFPAPEVRGFVVSDALHRLDEARVDLATAAAVSPAGFWTTIAEARRVTLADDPRRVLASGGPLPRGADADGGAEPTPVLADHLHLRLLAVTAADRATRFLAVRLPGLDAVAHYYLRYASPDEFGDVSDDERSRFGRVLANYYGVLDVTVGALMRGLGPDDLLLVVSSHGIEPLTPAKRLLERVVGDPLLSGTHERAPDGFVLAFGAAVQRGEPERASVADIAPTVLYYLGLPIGRDMDGRARTDLFTPEFTGAQPLTFVPSYVR